MSDHLTFIKAIDKAYWKKPPLSTTQNDLLPATFNIFWDIP